MHFKEDFLHFLWKFRLFDQRNLITEDGEPVEILSTGIHNSNAGPDFENVKLRIGQTLWVGNVEIHIRSSDWNLHQHSNDGAYNNVILHVVYEYDMPVFRKDGTKIASLVLKDHVEPDIKHRYSGLMQNLLWIPCEKLMPRAEDIQIENWLFRVLLERLEERSQGVLEMLTGCRGNWDETFYTILAGNFGFKTNAAPFELLAASLPVNILAKHKNNALQTEALVFGQAGFLENCSDEYGLVLKKEYDFLRKKYSLQPLKVYLWKFLRLHPQNFPTIRLAQFAALIIKSNHLFSKITETENVKDLTALFNALPVNEFWRTHYRFGAEVSPKSCQPGADSVNNILLNSVAVTLYSYGRYINKQSFIERSVELLENLPFEANHITRRFLDIGVKKGKAARSQALLQLKKRYCDQKKCLDCDIGAKIVNAN